MSVYSGNLMEICNGTGNSLLFRGTSYAPGTYIPMSNFLTFQVDYSKLWGSDSGRSMTGENKGTLVGIFPKIEMEMSDPGGISDADMSAFLALVNQASTDVRYFDTEKQAQVTMSFYFNDAEDKLKSKKRMTHQPIEIHAIANTKRS